MAAIGCVQSTLYTCATSYTSIIATDQSGGRAGNQSQPSMVELEPVSLAQTNITTIRTAGIEYANGFALANDGNAILNVAYSYGFAYGTFSHLVTPLSTGGGYTVDGGNAADPVASRNGAFYDASSELITVPGAMTESRSQEDSREARPISPTISSPTITS